jgi:hypothetical protein
MSNSQAANIPTDAELDNEMSLAFANDDAGTKLIGTAEQRGAYCVYAHYQHLVELKTALTSPEGMLTSPKGRGEVLAKMLERFSPDLTKEERKDRSDDALRATTQAARRAVLDRSLKLAAILMAHNIAMSQFSRDTGMWTVPVDMLLDHKRNEGALGRLTGATSTELNGASFLISYENKEGKQNYDKATASTTRLRSLHIKVTPRAAGGSQSQSGAPAEAVKETAVTKAIGSDLDKLVHAFAKSVSEVSETVPIDDSPETRAFFNDLAVIKIWLNRQETAQAEAARAKAKEASATKANGRATKANASKAA